MLNPTERDAESDAEGLAVSLAVAAQQGVSTYEAASRANSWWKTRQKFHALKSSINDFTPSPLIKGLHHITRSPKAKDLMEPIASVTWASFAVLVRISSTQDVITSLPFTPHCTHEHSSVLHDLCCYVLTEAKPAVSTKHQGWFDLDCQSIRRSFGCEPKAVSPLLRVAHHGSMHNELLPKRPRKSQPSEAPSSQSSVAVSVAEESDEKLPEIPEGTRRTVTDLLKDIESDFAKKESYSNLVSHFPLALPLVQSLPDSAYAALKTAIISAKMKSSELSEVLSHIFFERMKSSDTLPRDMAECLIAFCNVYPSLVVRSVLAPLVKVSSHKIVGTTVSKTMAVLPGPSAASLVDAALSVKLTPCIVVILSTAIKQKVPKQAFASVGACLIKVEKEAKSTIPFAQLVISLCKYCPEHLLSYQDGLLELSSSCKMSKAVLKSVKALK